MVMANQWRNSSNENIMKIYEAWQSKKISNNEIMAKKNEEMKRQWSNEMTSIIMESKNENNNNNNRNENIIVSMKAKIIIWKENKAKMMKMKIINENDENRKWKAKWKIMWKEAMAIVKIINVINENVK